MRMKGEVLFTFKSWPKKERVFEPDVEIGEEINSISAGLPENISIAFGSDTNASWKPL
jgi:hypothetical protein